MKYTHSLLTIAIQAVAFVSPLFAQSPISREDLLRAKGMMLKVCIALEEQAESMQRAGRAPGSLASAVGISAGMDEAETHALRSAAGRLRATLQPLDLQARAIIPAARQKYPGGKIPRGTAPPTPPAELLELQRRHDDAVRAAALQLDADLGQASAAKLEDHVREILESKKLRSLTPRTPLDIGAPTVRTPESILRQPEKKP